MDDVVCYLCSSELSRDELVSKLVVSKGREMVQLFDHSESIIGRLLPAYLNAVIRYQDGNLRTKDIGKEMLLFASGTMNISSAINTCGIKSGDSFVLFSNSTRLYKRISRGVDIKVVRKYRLKLDHGLASEVAMTPLTND
jgi:tRNA threonylcarbamoyladenosine modification (KEOPS) complex Cgi121 subunit